MSVPSTIEECLAYAADPAGIAAAEAVALELRRVESNDPPCLVWTTVPRVPPDQVGGVDFDLPLVRLYVHMARLILRTPPGAYDDYRDPGNARWKALCPYEWNRFNQSVAWAAANLLGPIQSARELDGEIPASAPSVPAAFHGRRFAGLPDLLGPLVAFWHTGYLLSGPTGNEIVLAAPAIERRDV